MTQQEAQEVITEAEKRGWFVNPVVRMIALDDPELDAQYGGASQGLLDGIVEHDDVNEGAWK